MSDQENGKNTISKLKTIKYLLLRIQYASADELRKWGHLLKTRFCRTLYSLQTTLRFVTETDRNFNTETDIIFNILTDQDISTIVQELCRHTIASHFVLRKSHQSLPYDIMLLV